MSYSTFSNESTESLNTASSTASPCSIRCMAKSRSSQQFVSNLVQPFDSDQDDSKTPTGSNGGDRGSSAQTSPDRRRVTRDPVSVPNFASLQKSNSLDEDDDDDAHRLLERAADALARTGGGGVDDKTAPALELAMMATHLSEGSSGDSSPVAAAAATTTTTAVTASKDVSSVPRSDSACTFQSYDCSSSRSSTLSSQASSNGNCGVGVVATTRVAEDRRGLCKSSSVNHGFEMGSETRLVGVEEEQENAELEGRNNEDDDAVSGTVKELICLALKLQFANYPRLRVSGSAHFYRRLRAGRRGRR